MGLGNIGFRHLQGLAAIHDRISLTGIDPDAAARTRAQTEWSAGNAKFSASLTDLPDTLSVAILATSAHKRLDLLESLLSVTRPENVILEKVVFQSPGDFEKAAALAANSGTRLWINCPRRTWPFYRQLRHLVAEEKAQFHMTARCSVLALACNGIHFIDMFQFIGNTSDVYLTGVNLDEIFPSKRPGYLEVYGTMDFENAAGSTFHLSTRPDDPSIIEGDIEIGTRRIDLRELEGEARDRITGDLLVNCGQPPFQSALTGKIVASLIDTGTCDLAELSESGIAHRDFLGALGTHFNKAGYDVSAGVPIT